MLSQEQLTAALKAFGDAVPTGTKLHSLKVTPSVGYTDTEAKPVFVFVLADSDKDVQRLSQVIDRGIKAFETEPCFTDDVFPLANDAAVAAIQFALDDDEGMQFLRLWNGGDFDVIRREWPEAPEEVFIGADPLHKPSKSP